MIREIFNQSDFYSLCNIHVLIRDFMYREYFCNVSWLFLQSCVMSISAMCHEYFCSVSWVILQCVMSVSTMCHEYFCNVSWVFFAICHEYFCNVSWIFHVYFPCNRLWMWSNQRSCYSTVPLSTNNPQQVII